MILTLYIVLLLICVLWADVPMSWSPTSTKSSTRVYCCYGPVLRGGASWGCFVGRLGKCGGPPVRDVAYSRRDGMSISYLVTCRL